MSWAWFILLPILVFACAILVLAAMPVEADEEIPEDEWGTGATNIEPAWTGLLREWKPVDETINPAMANLGYQLFFDPVLSGDNGYACATCHHPDYGFSDGKNVSMSPDGRNLTRNAPSIWNVAYQQYYFWDGRAESLPDQFHHSLTSDMEMNQDPAELVEELSAIEAYKTQFEAVFEDGVTFDNIGAAVSMFERTLVSDGA